MNDAIDHTGGPVPHSPEARFGRRLSDKILMAFHCACDQGNAEIAEQLLSTLDFMDRQAPMPPAGKERRSQDGLKAAYIRLWVMRNPEVLQQ